MPELSDNPVIKTLGNWRIRRRPDGTHYAENGVLVATTHQADAVFELRTVDEAMGIPTGVLGELLAEEIARGDHPRRRGRS
jgi:hypothetical protein